MTVANSEATPSAEAFLAGVLRDGAPLAPEYPLVFDAQGDGRVVTVEEDGRPVAGCALLSRVLHVGTARLPVGLIGSVATDPDHRRRGHATAALAQAEGLLTDAGAALALLWADDSEFYSALGWAPIGCEVNHVLPAEVAQYLPHSPSVRTYRPGDESSLHALYSAHATRVERSLDDTTRLLGVPNMTTLVLEREGAVCAYACEGRGDDLQGVIHEWGGAPLDVLALVRAHLERSHSQRVLMSPRDAVPIFRYLRVIGLEAQVGQLGMAKLLSFEAAAEVLRPLCPQLSIEAHADRLHLEGPGGVAEPDATQTLFLLAGPRGTREVVEAVEQLTGAELPDLPLAPFCWGLDSI